MTNIFNDSKDFMYAIDQDTNVLDQKQYDLYVNLIDEEHGELHEAIAENDRVEQLDALIDILVVTVGAINSMGADGEGAWKEVMRTNFAKVDPVTGKVRRREDRKVLKPEGWQGPELAQFLK
jgi:predicted HAD superfamily Cof-like phosphohydrolase